jgi:hypothetical protein
MVVWQCGCGQRLSLPEASAPRAVACPACGRAMSGPSAGGRSALAVRLTLAAVLALAAVIALGFWLVPMLPRSGRETPQAAALTPVSAAPEPAAPAENATSEGVPARPGAPSVSPDLPPPVPPPIRPDPPAVSGTPTSVRPDPPAGPASPTVVRVDPAEPRPGGPLTVYLGCGGGPNSVFQFRTGPGEEWRPAPDGRVQLADLKPGPVTIEFRTVDGSGKPSAAARRTWTVPPFPVAVAPAKPEAGLKEGDEFWQEVVISRMSRYRTLLGDMGQDTQYLLVSRFRVTKKEADGSLRVQQKVEGVRLNNADPALQAQLNALLQKTRGATFELTLNPRREVVGFKGGQEALKVFTGGNPLGGQTFLLWSFLDLDGWKELAEVSFFRPRQPVRKGEKWTRPMTHSWGPLGHWAGQEVFLHTGRQGPVERYDYVLDLGYKPPAGGGGLPFQVGKADFRLQTARGSIGFDPERGRVALAEERFAVRGVLSVSALGVDTAVEMDETQLFQLRLHDRNPLEK